MTALLDRIIPPAERPSVHAVVAVMLLFAISIVVFHVEAYGVLKRWWSDPTYSHGLLLAPMTILLILRAVGSLPPCVRRVDWLALLPMAVVALAMLLASVVDIAAIFQLLFPLLILSGLMTLFGRGTLRQLSFPAAFLYFSIPVWDAINPVLQALTIAAVERMVFFAGVPAFIDGNFVTVTAGIFEIAEGCSGLRFFIISGAISALYAYLYLEGRSSKIGFFALAIVLSIVGNWIRVFVVILMGIRLGVDHKAVTDHASIGWVIFAVTMLILFSVANRFRHRSPSVPNDHTNGTTQRASVSLSGALLPAIALAGLYGLVSVAELVLTAQSPRVLVSLNWIDDRGMRIECGDWRATLSGADDERRGVVQVNGQALCVDVVFFATQEQGKELINTRNQFFPTNRSWRVQQQIRSATPPAELLVVSRPGASPLLVAYQYRVAGNAVVDAREAKILQLRGLLAGRRDGLLVAYAMQCDEQCRETISGGRMPMTLEAALSAHEERDFIAGDGD